MSVLTTRSTFVLVTGNPGTGKSYNACRHAVTEILPRKKGRLITNVPLNVDKVVDLLTRDLPESEREEAAEKLRNRIVLIPRDVFVKWKDGSGNPVDFFQSEQAKLDDAWRARCVAAGLDPEDEAACREAGLPPDLLLQGAYVFIDEAGKCWPQRLSGPKKEQGERMAEWMATGRHEGCRVYLFCQSRMQILARMRELASIRIHHTNWRDYREPVTDAKYDTWSQFVAKLTGYYWQRVTVEEFVLSGDGREGEPHPETFWLEDWVFQLYTSHNNDNAEGHDSAEEAPEYIEYNWREFIAWMFRENSANWGWRLLCCLLFFVFFVWPGWVWSLFTWIMLELPKQFGDAAARQIHGAGQGAATSGAAVVPGAGVAPLVDRNAPPLEQQNAILIGELNEARRRVAELEVYSGRSAIVGVIGSTVLLESGESINVGEIITTGPLEGRKVSAVRGSVVVLDDGRLYVVRRPNREAAAAVAARPGVPATAPGSGFQPPGGGPHATPGVRASR